jgi:pimeloyl-ACP methyl ester carboxylesterase
MPRISISTGVTLDYAESGNPQGPVVVFVHGYLDSRRIWDPALPHLPKSYRLIFVSQRRSGDADKPQTGFTQTDYVKDLEAFLDTLGIRQATVVGHSMGGLIAHYFAVRNSMKPASWCWWAPRPRPPQRDRRRDRHGRDQRPDRPDRPAFVRMSQGTDPLAVPEAVEATSRRRSGTGRSWQGAMAGMLSEDHATSPAEIKCPVLILYGDGDMYFTMDEQRELQRLMPQARLKIYPGVGHGRTGEAGRVRRRPDGISRRT